MSNYRNQFLDALPANRGAALSLSARADASGMSAAGQANGLPSLEIPLDHARNRVEWFREQIQRYERDPPPGVGGDPTTHTGYRTMTAQRRGYEAEIPILDLLQQRYTLSVQPTTAASRALARSRAIQTSLGFSGDMRDQTDARGGQVGNGFAGALNLPHVNDVLREHPELNAASAAVTLKQENFIGRRMSLHAAAVGFQRNIAQDVINELQRQLSTATDGRAAIEARITQVTGLIRGVESGIRLFTGNADGLAEAAGHIDTALSAADRATGARLPGEGGDGDRNQMSDRQRARLDREEAHIDAQPDPHDMAERDEHGRVTGLSIEGLDRHRDMVHFDQAQQQRQRGVNAEHAVAEAQRRRAAGQGNAAAFREVARAERHGDTPNLSAAPDSAEARAGAAMQNTELSTARSVAGTTARGLGYLSTAVDMGMRMYYREELTTLTARIHEATSAIADWHEIQSRLALQESRERYDAEKRLFEAAAEEYQAALETRREQYQMIGRLADEAGAGPGHAPSTGNDFNSQAMLYMSSVGETRSMLNVALESARGADTQAVQAEAAMAHRRVAYDTRDTAWSTPLREERGPDEGVVWNMRQMLGGWIRDAETSHRGLDDEAASARGVMRESY